MIELANIMEFAMLCIISVLSTKVFDNIRDRKCCIQCNCSDVETLETNPDYVLVKNWKILILSYNYAYFYGLITYKCDSSLYQFMIVSMVQRIMCMYIMNTIHRKTSPYVHAGYYALYFLGGGINNANYYIMVCASLLTSVLSKHITGSFWHYSWNKQYINGQLHSITKENASNLNYEQAYSKLHIAHLYLIMLSNIVYHLLQYFFYKFI